MGKARQWAVSKKAVFCSQILGERLFFDITSLSTPTFGGKHHWLLVIDDHSDYSWSFFWLRSPNPTQKMIALIKDLKTKYNLQVQWLGCDNAGENQAFERTCNQEGLGIDFEYIAPGTPQQNGRVKGKFATLLNRVHAMLNGRKFTPYLRGGLWAEAANTATYLKITWLLPTGL